MKGPLFLRVASVCVPVQRHTQKDSTVSRTITALLVSGLLTLTACGSKGTEHSPTSSGFATFAAAVADPGEQGSVTTQPRPIVSHEMSTNSTSPPACQEASIIVRVENYGAAPFECRQCVTYPGNATPECRPWKPAAKDVHQLPNPRTATYILTTECNVSGNKALKDSARTEVTPGSGPALNHYELTPPLSSDFAATLEWDLCNVGRCDLVLESSTGDQVISNIGAIGTYEVPCGVETVQQRCLQNHFEKLPVPQCAPVELSACVGSRCQQASSNSATMHALGHTSGSVRVNLRTNVGDMVVLRNGKGRNQLERSTTTASFIWDTTSGDAHYTITASRTEGYGSATIQLFLSTPKIGYVVNHMGYGCAGRDNFRLAVSATAEDEALTGDAHTAVVEVTDVPNARKLEEQRRTGLGNFTIVDRIQTYERKFLVRVFGGGSSGYTDKTIVVPAALCIADVGK